MAPYISPNYACLDCDLASDSRLTIPSKITAGILLDGFFFTSGKSAHVMTTRQNGTESLTGGWEICSIGRGLRLYVCAGQSGEKSEVFLRPDPSRIPAVRHAGS